MSRVFHCIGTSLCKGLDACDGWLREISAPLYQTDRDVSLYPEEYGPGVVPCSGFALAAIAEAVYAVRAEIRAFSLNLYI
jgi:hypothetical protein